MRSMDVHVGSSKHLWPAVSARKLPRLLSDRAKRVVGLRQGRLGSDHRGALGRRLLILIREILQQVLLHPVPGVDGGALLHGWLVWALAAQEMRQKLCLNSSAGVRVMHVMPTTSERRRQRLQRLARSLMPTKRPPLWQRREKCNGRRMPSPTSIILPCQIMGSPMISR